MKKLLFVGFIFNIACIVLSILYADWFTVMAWTTAGLWSGSYLMDSNNLYFVKSLNKIKSAFKKRDFKIGDTVKQRKDSEFYEQSKEMEGKIMYYDDNSISPGWFNVKWNNGIAQYSYTKEHLILIKKSTDKRIEAKIGFFSAIAFLFMLAFLAADYGSVIRLVFLIIACLSLPATGYYIIKVVIDSFKKPIKEV